MKQKNKIWLYPLVLIMGMFLILTSFNNKGVRGENLNKNSTVTDIDGNVYKTLTIGTQVWMAENLKTTRYRNGDSISNVTVPKVWAALNIGAYCNYNNNEKNSTIYGRLYNWYAVNDGRGLAPKGWHVPTDAEWKILTTYLGGDSVAGGKLKEVGTLHWNSPNIEATNETGFTAIPSGHMFDTGAFKYIGSYGYWWSATKFDNTRACSRNLGFWFSGVHFYNANKKYGFSVRCLRDN